MKRHVMVAIEDFIHDQIKDKGINVSMICEDALRQILGTFDRTIDPESCEHNWTWPFATPMGLVKECKKCGLFKKVIQQTYEEIMGRTNKTNPSDAEVNTA